MKVKQRDITIPAFYVLLLTIFASCSMPDSNHVSSPDGSLSCEIGDNNGMITYSVSKNNKMIIDASTLGLKTDQFDLVDNIKIISSEKNTFKETWTQVWGEQKEVLDHHNELLIELSSNDNMRMMNVRFRAFNLSLIHI